MRYDPYEDDDTLETLGAIVIVIILLLFIGLGATIWIYKPTIEIAWSVSK